MKSGYLMGLDAGGGAGRCLLLEVGSGRVSLGIRPWAHPTAPGSGGMGYDLALDSIWSRLGEAAREAMERAGATPDRVVGVAVTSMRFAMIVLDREGGALFAVPNRDGRAIAEGMDLASERGDTLYARTGHWPSPVSVASRLRWLAAQRPADHERVASVLALSDWLAYRLSGDLAADPSHASDSLLYDLEKGSWAPDLLDALGIPPHVLPPVLEAGSRIGFLRNDAAEHLGLRPGTPVAVGGGDTHCGLLGAGVVSPGQAAAILGTSAPLQLVLDHPEIDPRQRLWTGCHLVPGAWVLESNAGLVGEVLEWFAAVLHPEAPRPLARLLAEAALSVPGAGGFRSTLGAQVMNAREIRFPTGTMTLSHLAALNGPYPGAQIARAPAEGVAYATRANLEQVLETARFSLGALRVGGGMSRSDFLLRLLSDVLDLPVEASPVPETSALGAALCAGVGAGLFRNLLEATAALPAPRTLSPDSERARGYGRSYGAWQRLRAAQAAADDVATEGMLSALMQKADASAIAAEPSIRPRILVTAALDEEALAAFRELGDVEYSSFRDTMRLLTGRKLVEVLRGVQVFVTEVDPLDASALRELPELRAVASCRGEAVNIDLAACSAFGVPVLNAPGRNAEAVADLTLAFLLMLARKLPEAAAFLRRPGSEAGDIGRMGQAFRALQGRELGRKTVGLVGFGSVGRAVARRLAGFGARVVVFDPHLATERVIAAGAEPVSLDELLERSDFVSVHAAVSTETRSLIGADELGRMKPGAFLINTARAALVDEDALADALRSGRLGGAALDVFSVEPPAADHPLLAFDNVIATPHIGGNTVDVAAHQGRIIVEDLRRLLRGERPLHVLNPETLDGFAWHRPRREPDAATLALLSARPAPAVSDLQRDRSARAPASSPARTAAAVAPPPLAGPVAPATARRLERLLAVFVERLARDESLRAAAQRNDVVLRFTLADFALSFHLALKNRTVSARLGDPSGPIDVDLKMLAGVLDGMFTGTVNPMDAMTSGRLSFAGDPVKAMALQELQEDLSRIYRAVREEVGGPGDLALDERSTHATASAAPRSLGERDIREDLIEVVNDLYASELITATGGNVSVRIPGTEDQLWITPSQLFKGQLRPESLVRIDLDGRSLDPATAAPSSERLMHCAAYRARSEARAVIHAHAPHATILANTGLPFLPISTEAAFFADLPRIPFVMPGTEELARVVGEALRGARAVLMQNHGLLVAGTSVRRAADMAEIIDRSAEVILGCYAVGTEPPSLPDELVVRLRKMADLVA